MGHLEALVLQVASTILGGQGLEFAVPSRTSANQQYIPELDRIVLKGKMSHRSFLSAGSVRKVGCPRRRSDAVPVCASLTVVHVLLRCEWCRWPSPRESFSSCTKF
jgi:hypothetical protein